MSDNRPALGDTRPSVSDLTAWVAGRATVRQFDSEADIPDDEIREIIDAGRKAPTSGTTQIYSFIWIRDQSRREHIHELCERGTIQVEEASHFLLVCIDVRRIQQLLEHQGREFMVSPLMGLLEGAIDASLAAGTAMLVAESKGYGICPIGNILNNLDGVAQEANLPAGVFPLYGLCIGVPAEGSPHENCPRVPLDGVLHERGYEDLSPALLDACHTAMDAMYSDSVYGDEQTRWADTLQRYWGPEGFMNNRESVVRRTLAQQGFLSYLDLDGQVIDEESKTETATPVSATTLGVLRVLTLEDPTEIAAHGQAIEDRFPTIETHSACIPNHPNGIPTGAAESEALPDIRSLARDMVSEVDALLISCALDPAVDELQHELGVPVIGAGQSVATAALSMGKQVGALGLEGGIPSVIKDRVGDHLHATEVINGAETTNHLTTETGREAIIVGAQRLEDAGCDVLAPSCTGLTTSNVLPEIAEQTSLTVVDPVLAMAGVALSRW